MSRVKLTTVKIVCAGPEERLSWRTLEKRSRLNIGVDRGALTLARAGEEFDVAIGDFDSVTAGELRLIEEKAKKVIKLDQEKDITDTEAAFAYVLKHAGKKDVCIDLITPVGGRFDHKLANISLMLNYLKKGISEISIEDSSNKIEIYEGETDILQRLDHQYVSFFAIDGVVKNLTLTNVKYPIENYDLAPHDTLCISNEASGALIGFKFDSGCLAIIQSND